METPVLDSNAPVSSDDLLSTQDFLLEEIRLLRASLHYQIQASKAECVASVRDLVVSCRQECLDHVLATKQECARQVLECKQECTAKAHNVAKVGRVDDVRMPMMPLQTQDSFDVAALAAEVGGLRQGILHLQNAVAPLMMKASREAPTNGLIAADAENVFVLARDVVELKQQQKQQAEEAHTLKQQLQVIAMQKEANKVGLGQYEQDELRRQVEELMEKTFSVREQSMLSQVRQLEVAVKDLQGRMAEWEQNPQDHNLTPAVDRLQERIPKCEGKLFNATLSVAEHDTGNNSERPGSKTVIIKQQKPNEEAIPTASVTVTGVDLKHDGIPDVLQNVEDKETRIGGEEGCEAAYSSGFELEPLEQSIWDMIIFIGMPQTGILGSVFVAVLVFINALIQFLLCCVVNDVFTIPTIDAQHILFMREWRVSFGHSTDLMNQLTHESFVSKVCNSPLSTQMATPAGELMDIIGGYMPSEEDYDLSDPVVGPILPYDKRIGKLLSFLAIFIWAMEISKSILKISHKRWAIKTLPTKARSVLVWKGKSHQFLCISDMRKLSCMVILLIEFFVLMFLCFAGVLFLIRTIVLQDLLLNCSALVIVLEIDELIFTALVPHRSRYLLTTLEPLPRPLSRNWSGFSLSSLFSAALISIICGLSIWQLELHGEILEDTRNEICGGNLDFVARQDGIGALAAAHVKAIDDIETTYYYKAMRTLVTEDTAVSGWFIHDGSAGTSGVTGGPWSLMSWTSRGLDASISYWNAECEDRIPIRSEDPGARYFLHMLRDAVGDSSIKDCIDVQQYCNADNLAGTRTRMFCPISCGCHEPGVRLVLGGSNGCSSTCQLTAAFNASMWSRTCEDFGLEAAYWSDYGKGLNEFMSGYKDWTNTGLSADMLLTSGCDLVKKETDIFGSPWKDLCEIHDGSLKPLTYACPVACHCKEQLRYLCPYTCALPA